MTSTGATDPRLGLASWKRVRAYWRAQRVEACQAPACVRPDIPIQYDGPRGPWHLDVGHIVPRAVDDRRVWTVQDTRPEHARCSRRAGARLRHSRRRPAQADPYSAPILHSQQW